MAANSLRGTDKQAATDGGIYGQNGNIIPADRYSI